jgi:hypothetical protein
VLLHSGRERCIIFLCPSTKRVEEKKWVLVASLEELFSGVLEEKNVSVVEWVPNLESINNISISLLHKIIDFLWGESVLV